MKRQPFHFIGLILIIGIFMFSISFCRNQTKTSNTLIIPLKMGLAENNGATPWYAELSIGESPKDQLFKLIMDTGTASTWITSDECKTVPCKHHRGYNTDQSPSYIWIDTVEKSSELGPWGSFNFKVGQDSWNFWAGSTEDLSRKEKYAVPGMRFLLTTSLNDGKNPDGTFNTNWDDLVQDGSLAFPSQSSGNPSIQILDLLLQQQLISDKIVSFWTSRELNRGEVMLGGIDHEKFKKGSLKFFPLVKETARQDHAEELWTIELVELKVGDIKIDLPNSTVFALDTGSSRFKGDPEIIGNITSLITDKGTKPVVVNDASELEDYPDFTITLRDENGKLIQFTLSAGEYFQQFPDSLHLAFYPLYPTKSSSTTNMLLAGSIFLDHYYTIFDYTASPLRLGIAEKK